MRKPKTRATQWHKVVHKLTRQKTLYEDGMASTPASRLHHYIVDCLCKVTPIDPIPEYDAS